jgi:hypothetical protein
MKNITTILIAIIVLPVLQSCCKDVLGCTDQKSFNYNPEATVSDGSCSEMFGCLGYVGGAVNSGNTGLTLNSPFYDQKMNEEVNIQKNFFSGIPAAVFILYEKTPEEKNAYATPDGKILFGYYMFYYTIQNFNELAASGILAHEWGHRVQYTYGWSNSPHPHIELEADAFSGYYMALAKSFAWSQIQGYYASTYATGDYNFNHPTHHGTPDQRLAAAYLGVNTATEAITNNHYYSYNELHTIFINVINTQIVGKKAANQDDSVYTKIANGQTKGEEVSFLNKLTPSQIDLLKPR